MGLSLKFAVEVLRSAVCAAHEPLATEADSAGVKRIKQNCGGSAPHRGTGGNRHFA